jgi:flagellar protein FliS
MSSDPLSTYKSTHVETASKEKILLMLYDELISTVREARDALEDADKQNAHDNLLHAQEIVTELLSTLDMDVGGDIADELYSLYDYVLHNLIQANVENEPSRLNDVLPVVEDLQEAWDEVINEKGMTLEKARREVNPGTNASPAPTGADQDSVSEVDSGRISSDRDQEGASPSSQDDGTSFDGDVTYGDI